MHGLNTYMKKYIFLQFLLLLLFASCSRDNVEILTGGNYRYWKHNVKVNGSCNIVTYEYFDIRGRWTFFGFTDGKLKKVNTYDVIPNEHWHFEGDSILSFDNYKYNIVSISDKRIILNRSKQNDTLFAVNEEDIPLKYRRLWDFSSCSVDVLDRLYKSKIDSLYCANIKYLYNGLKNRGIVNKADSISIYIDDQTRMINRHKIKKMLVSFPVKIQDRLSDKTNQFILCSPKMYYGLVSFPILLPKGFKVLGKDSIDICYEYELDEYFMQSSILEELYW